MKTPIGEMEIVMNEDRLVELRLLGAETRVGPNEKNGSESRVEQQLREYFEGKRREFDVFGLAEDMIGRQIENLVGKEFQKIVWKEIAKIAFAKTMTYKELAERVGRPKAVRAVANACGANPVPIVVPCHRVVASGGGLGGYSGGIEMKRWLLEHEGVKVGGVEGLRMGV